MRQPPLDGPPRWIDALLRRCLSPRDRDPISGDLLEEYRDARLAGSARVMAGARYLTQAVSVAVFVLRPPTPATRVLAALSGLSICGVGWLAVGSSNSLVPVVGSVLIAQSAATIAAACTARSTVHVALLPGAAAVLLVGLVTLAESTASTPFDWKGALLGATFVVQGWLTAALQANCLGGFHRRDHVR